MSCSWCPAPCLLYDLRTGGGQFWESAGLGGFHESQREGSTGGDGEGGGGGCSFVSDPLLTIAAFCVHSTASARLRVQSFPDCEIPRVLPTTDVGMTGREGPQSPSVTTAVVRCISRHFACRDEREWSVPRVPRTRQFPMAAEGGAGGGGEGWTAEDGSAVHHPAQHNKRPNLNTCRGKDKIQQSVAGGTCESPAPPHSNSGRRPCPSDPPRNRPQCDPPAVKALRLRVARQTTPVAVHTPVPHSYRVSVAGLRLGQAALSL